VVSKSCHALLHTLVDYAGLFPPAGLAMPAAVGNYAEYRRSSYGWMLGRFVVPVARLDEFASARSSVMAPSDDPHWRVAALLGDDATRDAAQIEAFNANGRGIWVDAVEVKAPTPDAIRRVAAAVPRTIKVYVEIPVADDPHALVAAVAESKVRAKVRTGGVTPDAFPPVEQVGRFLRECYATNVAFKATAGLHHPLRSVRALTYEPNSPRGVMHGFLNVFLTAAFHYNGLTHRDADALLNMTSLEGVEFADDALVWKDYRVSLAELSTVRRRFAVSFGSCSFREPVDELIQLGLLS
jgi:hypothetical protein